MKLFYADITFLFNNNSNVEKKESHYYSYIKKLPNKLKESSGLIYYDNLFWTINDSNGEPELYGISTNTGKIKRTIKLINATNYDWEALTQDSSYIYQAPHFPQLTELPLSAEYFFYLCSEQEICAVMKQVLRPESVLNRRKIQLMFC